MNNIYYVYIYLDPRKSGTFQYKELEFNFEPFYVGKGKGERYIEHIVESKSNFKINNQFKLNKIRKIKNETGENPIIIKFKENLSEEESLKLEEIIIEKIGRIDLGTGPLTNLSYKGAPSGYIKLSETIKGKPKSPEVIKMYCDGRRKGKNHHMFGKITPIETKLKISLSNSGDKNHMKLLKHRVRMRINMSGSKNPMYGKKRPEQSERMVGDKNPMKNLDTRSKVSNTLKSSGKLKNNNGGSKWWILISKDGIEYKIRGLSKFCKTNNLNYQGMLYSFKQGKEFYGWKGTKIL
jgi:hypothetical protein